MNCTYSKGLRPCSYQCKIDWKTRSRSTYKTSLSLKWVVACLKGGHHLNRHSDMTKNYNLFILFLKDADPVSKGTAGSENRTILNYSRVCFVFFSQIYLSYLLYSCIISNLINCLYAWNSSTFLYLIKIIITIDVGLQCAHICSNWAIMT